MKKVVEVVGLILALVGVAFAINEYFEFRRQSQALEQQRAEFHAQQDKLLQIEGEIKFAAEEATTRFTANFPKNLPSLVELMNKTCRSLDIMADTASYGFFSNSEAFFKYLDEIQALSTVYIRDRQKLVECSRADRADKSASNPKVQIRLLIYEPALLRKAIANQFKEADYAALTGSATYHDFFQVHTDVSVPQDYQDFISTVTKMSLDYATQLAKRGVSVRVSDHRYMVYLWMHDSSAAAFSLDYQGDATGYEEKEITFESKDSTLTNAFSDIFELEWSKGKDFLKSYPAGVADSKPALVPPQEAPPPTT